jgi:hypothetical protein
MDSAWNWPFVKIRGNDNGFFTLTLALSQRERETVPHFEKGGLGGI